MRRYSEIVLQNERERLAFMIGYFLSKEEKAMKEVNETIRELEDDMLFLHATGGSAALLRELRQTAFAFNCRGRMYLEQRAKHPEKDQYYHGRHEEAKEAEKILEDFIDALVKQLKGDPDPEDEPDLSEGEEPARSTFRATTRQDGTISVDCWTNDNLDKGYPTEESYWVQICRTREEFDKMIGKSRIGCAGTIVDVFLDGEKL